MSTPPSGLRPGIKVITVAIALMNFSGSGDSIRLTTLTSDLAAPYAYSPDAISRITELSEARLRSTGLNLV